MDAVFGCSFTEGEGLPAKDRWGDVLAKKLNLKCYNFGEGGKGMNAVYNNISEWIPKLKPKAVFVFASFPFRHDVFINSTERTLNYNITNESLDCSKGVGVRFASALAFVLWVVGRRVRDTFAN